VGILIYKGLTAQRLYKSFGVKGLKLLKEVRNRICAEHNRDNIRFIAGTLNIWVLIAEISQVNENHVHKSAVTEDIAWIK
jgi:hypothetical protein